MKKSIFVFSLIIAGIFLVASNSNAQLFNDGSCNDACGNNETCTYDGEQYFYCRSNTTSTQTSGLDGPYVNCNQCGSRDCQEYDGDFYCVNDENALDGGGQSLEDERDDYFNQQSNNPNLDCSSGVCFPSTTGLPDPSGGVAEIIRNIMLWILSIFGILAVIAFAISGAQYVFSAGDEKMIDRAKAGMKWSIVGVVVALSGLVIIYAIQRLLSATPNF